MNGNVLVQINLDRPFQYRAVLSVGDENHCHYYTDTGTASGEWLWCGECKCFVTTPCDHRKRICRDRKRMMVTHAAMTKELERLRGLALSKATE